MKRKKKNQSEGKITSALNNSPINYFSDLFVMAMVVAWIVVLIVMMIMAIWATVHFADTTIWCYVQELTAVPLTAGGSLWMLKNAVQHAIANNKGETCPQDFPKVPVDMDGNEETMDGSVG